MLPPAILAALAATVVAAYAIAWGGAAIAPWPFAAVGLAVGLAFLRSLRVNGDGPDETPIRAWWFIVLGNFACLLWPAWPTLVPPGGASDLTHHLQLVDVLERTRHLVDGVASEAAMGEMAHYTPGLHLLVVIAGSLASVDAYRAAYPLLALTIALKASVLFLIAYDTLAGARGRVALAASAVALVLFAPRAYSLDGFLQAGFYAQVASELFVVAGWWGLARWWRTRRMAWMALVGLMGAAVFLVWPIWIGPLMAAVAVAVVAAPDLTWPARVRHLTLAGLAVAVVAAMHLSRHAAWLRMAGTSGAVPALSLGPHGWVLVTLAIVGGAAAVSRSEAHVTRWFALGLALQALALFGLARARGAETPYMAMKMVYLAVYPAAVMGAYGLGAVLRRTHTVGTAWAWAALLVVLAAGLRTATASPVPPPIVDVDLDAAGRWARANLAPACVDYIVDNAEQAYWLHLAVMGQPRSSPRTAELDAYTSNRATGRWLEGTALPYAIARRSLLPRELLGEIETAAAFGSAVVIKRRGAACAPASVQGDG